MRREAIVKVLKSEAGWLQGIMNTDQQVKGYRREQVIKTFTADFGGGSGILADIEVCNGDTGPWVNAVLFKDGQEIMCLEPGTTLLGECLFDLGGDEYVVKLVEGIDKDGLNNIAVCIKCAIEELEGLHGDVHPECSDEGETTCPSWAAIHMLRRSLENIRAETGC